MNSRLKLYVWNGDLSFAPSQVLALAESMDEAREMIQAEAASTGKVDGLAELLSADAEIYTGKMAMVNRGS